MTWITTLHSLSNRLEPLVLITITSVRGHAPRGAGSKMIVTQDELHGSVGGGNLEQRAISRARELLNCKLKQPETLTATLNPKGGDYGVQCCGGEVTLLLEPLYPHRPHVAIFGAGHVGWALVKILTTLPIDISLVDSRLLQLELHPIETLEATVTPIHAPVPETVVHDLPAGAHLLVMTHDHAEDLAVLDIALRREDLGFLGLIGSRTKWGHFQGRLLESGYIEADLKRVTTPIGLAGVPGKSPQAIAIATAAQLLGVLGLEEADF